MNRLSAQQLRYLGIGLTAAGSWLLYQGYENRGHKRPWALRFLPGP